MWRRLLIAGVLVAAEFGVYFWISAGRGNAWDGGPLGAAFGGFDPAVIVVFLAAIGTWMSIARRPDRDRDRPTLHTEPQRCMACGEEFLPSSDATSTVAPCPMCGHVDPPELELLPED